MLKPSTYCTFNMVYLFFSEIKTIPKTLIRMLKQSRNKYFECYFFLLYAWCGYPSRTLWHSITWSFFIDFDFDIIQGKFEMNLFRYIVKSCTVYFHLSKKFYYLLFDMIILWSASVTQVLKWIYRIGIIFYRYFTLPLRS